MTEEQAKHHYENPSTSRRYGAMPTIRSLRSARSSSTAGRQNYYAEVEQAAFTPAHVVPGIGFSPDKFLQGRLFVYGDAQRYRLGVNHNEMVP